MFLSWLIEVVNVYLIRNKVHLNYQSARTTYIFIVSMEVNVSYIFIDFFTLTQFLKNIFIHIELKKKTLVKKRLSHYTKTVLN